ncbi:MAG: GTPase HflX [Candidatus Dormibacteraeota bacterium]|nr:GTPase HflX [Candidatus Dormibacteraeota bacterium]
MLTTAERRDRAYLLGVLLPGTEGTQLEEQMAELAELVRTAGADPVATDIQRRTAIDPALFCGRGKVDEIRARRGELEFDLLVCNEDLSPRQQRNLERELSVPVLDRTEIILEIFALHARTREGRLQVEVARLRHWLPRLVGAYDVNRQMGGRGTRGGPGEQQTEIERRRVRRQLRDLERELEHVRARREQQRRGRDRADLTSVAIVGYTNAGKSTLLNAMTGAGVPAVHQLFATLDPTTRRHRTTSRRELLLSDTVGFIQHLPTDLVAAFRSTLEEVTEADVVLHVVDASSPSALEQAATVDQVLAELGAGDRPRVVALNKIDLLGGAGLRRVLAEFRGRYGTVIPISAQTGAALDELDKALTEADERALVPVRLLVPYGREGVIEQLRREGVVEDTEFTERGTLTRARAPEQAVHRYRELAVERGDRLVGDD